MGKKEQMNLGELKNYMSKKADTTPMQTTVVEDKKTTKSVQVEESRFTVVLPTELMDSVREIAFFKKKKLKKVFEEALEDYVKNNK